VTLAAISIVVALGLGYAAGGRLPDLLRLRLRWPLAATGGLLLQVVPFPGSLRALTFPALLLSFLLLGAFTVVNIRLVGFPVILLGLALNVAVIAPNRGMPVTRQALAAAHELQTLAALERGGGHYHLASEKDVLVPLADGIGAAMPFHLVISPGDVAIYAGFLWFLVWGMLPRGRHRQSRTPSLLEKGFGAHRPLERKPAWVVER
jgi:hypothetical protein